MTCMSCPLVTRVSPHVMREAARRNLAPLRENLVDGGHEEAGDQNAANEESVLHVHTRVERR